MKTEYKRDMNHSFMILSGTKMVDTTSYQTRMLIGNGIPGLLKCRLQAVDGKTLFYYDITSRQPLKVLYENKKFNLDDLRLILGCFVQTMETMAEFLLNPENLMISPEYIYVDIEKKQLYFCYLPGYEHAVREQFQTLTEYILPKLKHEDGNAVMLGYGVYRRALEDSFHLEYIKEELYRTKEKGEGKEESLPIPEPDSEDSADIRREQTVESERSEPMLWRQDTKETPDLSKTKKVWIRKGLVFLWVIVIILGMAGGKALGYLPWLTAEVMIGAGIILLGLGTFFCMIMEKKKKEHLKRNDVKEKKVKFCEKEQSSSTEAKQMDNLLKNQETDIEIEKENIPKEFGETVVLSSKTKAGPATLVSKEPGELATIYLTEEITVIGKLETAVDAVIPLPTVSRIHAKIRKRDEEYFLCDLNSKNGTSVNGRMLKNEEEYCLQEEDEIDFAQARYIFLR